MGILHHVHYVLCENSQSTIEFKSLLYPHCSEAHNANDVVP